MRKSLVALAVVAAALATPLAQAQQARQIKSVGITLGSLGNPFFVALAKGAEAKVRQINPAAKVTALSADYDLGKQFSQIDSFIASGVDVILVNAVDAKAIGPAIAKAKKAGIAVVGVDVAANGADAAVQTDNVQAGQIACQFIVEKLGGKGNVVALRGIATDYRVLPGRGHDLLGDPDLIDAVRRMSADPAPVPVKNAMVAP